MSTGAANFTRGSIGNGLDAMQDVWCGLGAGIIQVAVDDYRSAIRHLYDLDRKYKGKRYGFSTKKEKEAYEKAYAEANEIIEECNDFFTGSWFRILANGLGTFNGMMHQPLDPERVMNAIWDSVEAEYALEPGRRLVKHLDEAM